MGIGVVMRALCIFAGGFILGQINAPEPKVLPCMKKPAVMYESRGDVKYWRDYTRSLPK